MIKSVHLVNFFSFGDCTVELEPDLNVLVGINGSGKSNFLRAFQLLKAGMDGRLQEQIAQWGGINSLRNKSTISKKTIPEIELSFTISTNLLFDWPDSYRGDVIYQITLLPLLDGSYRKTEVVRRPDGWLYFDSLSGAGVISTDSKKDNAIQIQEIRESRELYLPLLHSKTRALHILYILLTSLDIYRLFNTTEDAPMRTTIRATGVDKLLPNGDNMFQVLNTTGLKSTAAYDAIEAGLHDVNEHFQRFRMNVYGQGSVEFYLQEKGLETPIHAAQVSDGTLSYLCLLVALYQPGRGRVVIFDEPERNLHPDMLLELGKQLEKASESCQILVTTHAPGLLNQFPLRAVRVFEKDENNQTQVRQFTEESFAGWYEEFAPGQMWRDGALGGNRY